MVKTGVFVSNNTEGYALKGCGFVRMLNGGGLPQWGRNMESCTFRSYVVYLERVVQQSL